MKNFFTVKVLESEVRRPTFKWCRDVSFFLRFLLGGGVLRCFAKNLQELR
jgi:hypothetical protein